METVGASRRFLGTHRNGLAGSALDEGAGEAKCDHELEEACFDGCRMHVAYLVKLCVAQFGIVK